MTMSKKKKGSTARRLEILATLMESRLEDLEPFLDFLAREPLTDRRCCDARWILGLPNPIWSHLTFPQMTPPSVGGELPREFLRWEAADS